MAVQRYVALLRGINVGGRNPVPMAALREACADAGMHDVTTYIQSGNVLFSSDAPARDLEGRIEAALEARFGIPIVVVVRSHRQLRAVVRSAPDGFGAQPDRYHSDAIFLKAPLTPTAAMRVVQVRDEVDQAWADGRALLRPPQRTTCAVEAVEDRGDARVPAHDHPQLDHDHQAPRPARRRSRALRCPGWVSNPASDRPPPSSIGDSGLQS